MKYILIAIASYFFIAYGWKRFMDAVQPLDDDDALSEEERQKELDSFADSLMRNEKFLEWLRK